jgi:tetratricopeptide (TPR) repeat protein
MLLSMEAATAQPNSPLPAASFQPTSTLSSPQREEVERLIKQEIKESKDISEIVQSEVDRTFGWTISLINLLITVLIAIPIVTGLAALFLRRSIIDQLVQETRKQLQEETEREVKAQLETQIAGGLKREVEDFRQELEAFRQELQDLKSDFGFQLNNLFIAAQSEKDKIFQEIAKITPSVIQSEFVAPEIQKRIHELTQRLEFLKSANPQLYLSAEDYTTQGHALWCEERYEEALDSYEKALQINPDLAHAWSGKGKALDRLNRYEEALNFYDQAIQRDPNNYRTWFGRGYTLRNLKRYEEALIAYEKTINLKPDYHHAWNHRSYVLMRLNRYQEALPCLEKVLEIQPSSSSLYYNQAFYCMTQGQIESALENLKLAIKLQPKILRDKAQTYADFETILEDERFKQLMND